MLGLRFCVRAFFGCGERGPLFIAVAGLSLSWPLLLWSTGSRRAGSVVVAHGPSCSAACGIFPDQGSNPCPLHWQADSQPLCHQGSPHLFFIKYCFPIVPCFLLQKFISDNCWSPSIYLLFFLTTQIFTNTDIFKSVYHSGYEFLFRLTFSLFLLSQSKGHHIFSLCFNSSLSEH